MTKAALAKVSELEGPGLSTIEGFRAKYDYLDDFERPLEGLRRAGMPED